MIKCICTHAIQLCNCLTDNTSWTDKMLEMFADADQRKLVELFIVGQTASSNYKIGNINDCNSFYQLNSIYMAMQTNGSLCNIQT
jgi:hypothetical protein